MQLKLCVHCITVTDVKTCNQHPATWYTLHGGVNLLWLCCCHACVAAFHTRRWPHVSCRQQSWRRRPPANRKARRSSSSWQQQQHAIREALVVAAAAAQQQLEQLQQQAQVSVYVDAWQLDMAVTECASNAPAW